MDAVTYPHDDVARAIDTHFAPFKVNMLERHPDFREACSGGRVLWGPTLIVKDGRDNELRRWTGWLPPACFVAELDFCRATADYHRGAFADALAGFTALAESAAAAAAPIHAEAIYWQGAAGFLAGGKDWDALRRSWTRLVAEYPGHRFATYASVIEDAPS